MQTRLISFLFLFTLLAGCAPSPAPEPTPDINLIIGTMMSSTLTAIAPTPVPPTETPAPEPTPTETPPGTLKDDFGAGFVFPVNGWFPPYDSTDPTGQVNHNYSVSADQDFLKFELLDVETFIYAFNQKDLPADVEVYTSYKLVGKRNAEVALACRVDPNTRTSWYEFRINHFDRTGHIYYFNRVDPYNNPYNRLGYAKLPVELFTEQENRFRAICQGSKLTLFLNDIEVVSVEDPKIPGGGFAGLGALVHSEPPLNVFFNNLYVNPPGQ
jgi:hypothetical protein